MKVSSSRWFLCLIFLHLRLCRSSNALNSSFIYGYYNDLVGHQYLTVIDGFNWTTITKIADLSEYDGAYISGEVMTSYSFVNESNNNTIETRIAMMMGPLNSDIIPDNNNNLYVYTIDPVTASVSRGQTNFPSNSQSQITGLYASNNSQCFDIDSDNGVILVAICGQPGNKNISIVTIDSQDGSFIDVVFDFVNNSLLESYPLESKVAFSNTGCLMDILSFDLQGNSLWMHIDLMHGNISYVTTSRDGNRFYDIGAWWYNNDHYNDTKLYALLEGNVGSPLSTVSHVIKNGTNSYEMIPICEFNFHEGDDIDAMGNSPFTYWNNFVFYNGILPDEYYILFTFEIDADNSQCINGHTNQNLLNGNTLYALSNPLYLE